MQAHPAATEFPPSCPRYGMRGDRHAYSGHQYKVWVNADGIVESALYRPAGAKRPLDVALRMLLDRTDREIARPSFDFPPDNPCTCLDLTIDADETAAQGPGYTNIPEDGPGAEPAAIRIAARADLLERLRAIEGATSDGR